MATSKRSSVTKRGSGRLGNGAMTARSQRRTSGRVRAATRGAKKPVSRARKAVQSESGQRRKSPALAQGFAVKIDGIKSAVPSAWMFGS